MTQTIYYICEMAEAVNKLGIVSKPYYHNDPSVVDRNPKKGVFTCKILFEGSFNECLEKKKSLLRK